MWPNGTNKFYRRRGREDQTIRVVKCFYNFSTNADKLSGRLTCNKLVRHNIGRIYSNILHTCTIIQYNIRTVANTELLKYDRFTQVYIIIAVSLFLKETNILRELHLV